jgi:predicted phage-related endonuclease
MRKFIVIDEQQRSPAWSAARAGRLTGSRANCILAQGKGGKESVQRRDYRLQLVAERISGYSQENIFSTIEMQRGVELEPLAFAHYEALTGQVVRKTGFLQHTELMAGCSLDGDINDFSGIVELKCPKMATHLAYREDPSELRAEYMPQVRHNLWITGAAFCDLISFDDRLPTKKQFLRVRVERGDADILSYEREAIKFLGEVDAIFANIMDEESDAA